MTESSAESEGRADLLAAARGAVRWTLVAQVASQLTSLVVVGVLCRWIAPAEFGVFNTALLIVSLPRMLVQLGLTAIVIQRPRHSSGQLNSLFWFNLMLALPSVLAALALAAFIDLTSGSGRLLAVATALAGSVPVAALGTMHLALLERRLRFNSTSLMRWLAQLAGSSVAIVLAARSFTVEALIAQQYAEWVVLVVAAWRLESWRPSLPWRRGESGADSRGESIRESLRFGSHIVGVNFVFYIAQNIDKLLLYALVGGTTVGEAAVGMYSLAFNFMMKPVNAVSTSLSSVMLPALSRAAAERVHNKPRGKKRQRDGSAMPLASTSGDFGGLVAHFYRLCSLLLAPCGVGLWLVAHDAMRVQAGPQWDAAGLVLRWLAPVVVVHGLYNLSGSVVTATGDSGWQLRSALVLLIVQVQGYLAGYWLGGLALPPPWGHVYGVAASYSLGMLLILFVPFQWVVMKRVGLDWRQVFAPQLRLWRAAILMGLGVWAFQLGMNSLEFWRDAAAIVRLVILAILGAVLYAALVRNELRQCFAVGTSGRNSPPGDSS
jgi:O-antigen/teichoic acid export membrane protein